jgi:lyso-ornithine lipid O-acyltransferase
LTTAWSCTASRSTASADPLSGLRIAVRLTGLALLLLACLPAHLFARLFGRSPVPPRFLGWCGWIIGARVRTIGAAVRPPSLIVANHISWMDILVLGGACRCAFVSKDDLGPGIMHWLADQNHTLYVKRSDRRGSKDQALAIARALEGPQPVALFPEGTVGPGDEVLPFRSTLLEAAFFAGEAVTIRPVALEYANATEISWFGEGARDNFLRVLGRRGTLPVTVHLLPPLERGGDRKALALSARQAIADALSASSPATSRL